MPLVRVRSLLVVSLAAAFAATACGQGNAVLTPTGPSASLGSAALTSDVSATLDASQVSTAGAVAAPQRKGDQVDTEKGGGKPPKPGQDGDVEKGELDTPEVERGRPTSGIGGGKIAVCHRTNGINEFIPMSIASPALPAHLAHGDFVPVGVPAGEGVTNSPDCGIIPPTVEGVVSGLPVPAVDCPLITFMVGTDPEVTVTTTGSTQYFGVACETLADDAVVNVEGTLQLDGSIAATTISIVPVVVDIPVEPLLP